MSAKATPGFTCKIKYQIYEYKILKIFTKHCDMHYLFNCGTKSVDNHRIILHIDSMGWPLFHHDERVQ